MIRSIHNSSLMSWPVRTVCLLLFLVSASGIASADDTKAQQLYEAVCTQCHSLAPIEITRDGRKGWEDTVHKMVIVGAELDTEEMELLIDYLYRRRGPDASDPMRTGPLPFDSPLYQDGTVGSENIVLPAGDGKALVEAYCMMCHDLGRVVATRRGEREWHGYVTDMLNRNNMTIGKEQSESLLAYLNKHFGRTE